MKQTNIEKLKDWWDINNDGVYVGGAFLFIVVFVFLLAHAEIRQTQRLQAECMNEATYSKFECKRIVDEMMGM